MKIKKKIHTLPPLLWQRYFLKQLFWLTLAFFLLLAALYCAVDYATRAATFHNRELQASFGELLLYYSGRLLAQSDLLLSFSFFLASYKVLAAARRYGELIALMAAGISRKQLLTPFIAVGCMTALFQLAAGEWLLPPLTVEAERIDNHYTGARHRKKYGEMIGHLALAGNSAGGPGGLLLFRRHSEEPLLGDFEGGESHQFQGVIWAPTFDEIWRIQRLVVGVPTAPPIAYGAEHYLREPSGALALAAVLPQTPLQGMVATSWEAALPSNVMPTSWLARELSLGRTLSQRGEEWWDDAAAVFLRRLALPWLSCAALPLIAAPLFSFQRRNLSLLAVPLRLCCFISLYLLLDATLLLVKRQALEIAPACVMSVLLLALPSLGWLSMRDARKVK